MKLVLLALLVAGCGYQIPVAGNTYDGPTNPQPDQDKAIHIVWDVVYDIGGDPPPIIWHFGDRCNPNPNMPNSFIDPDGGGDCLLGIYNPWGYSAPGPWAGANRIDVEWNGRFSATQAFAHELCHAYMKYTTDDPDASHAGPCFSYEGVQYSAPNVAPGSLVDQAVQALIFVGL
jgi:hypothetical protein